MHLHFAATELDTMGIMQQPAMCSTPTASGVKKAYPAYFDTYARDGQAGANISIRHRQPLLHRAQRAAPVQQHGSFHAHRYAGGGLHAGEMRECRRCLECQRRKGISQKKKRPMVRNHTAFSLRLTCKRLGELIGSNNKILHFAVLGGAADFLFIPRVPVHGDASASLSGAGAAVPVCQRFFIM